MLRIIALTVILAFGMQAHSQEDSSKITVLLKVDILESDEEDGEINSKHEPYVLFIEGSRKKLNFISRTSHLSAKGMKYYLDRYETTVAPGFYRIVISDFERYKLPNFRIRSNETYTLSLPEERFATEFVCMGQTIITKVYFPGESADEYEERYAETPYANLKNEMIRLEDPFEMVLDYCRKTVNGSTSIYEGVRVYYKDYYIESNKMILDMDQRKVTFSNKYSNPTVEKQGDLLRSLSEQKFELFF